MEFRLISSICTAIQCLSQQQKRQNATSHNTYNSRGIVYMLIYGCYLIHLPKIVMAETTISQNRVNVGRGDMKNTHDINQLNAIDKIDDGDDEYFYDDQEENEYKDLISNKSGKC